MISILQCCCLTVVAEKPPVPETMICGWMSFQYNSALAALKLRVY